ncbi:hypothetical protein ACV275_000617 [Enterobacter cloacae]
MIHALSDETREFYLRVGLSTMEPITLQLLMILMVLMGDLLESAI